MQATEGDAAGIYLQPLRTYYKCGELIGLCRVNVTLADPFLGSSGHMKQTTKTSPLAPALFFLLSQ